MRCIFWLVLSTLYARLYWFFHNVFKINIPGLGWLMREIGRDLVLEVQGVKLFVNKKIAGSNSMHLIGKWNEPETHIFVRKILNNVQEKITFIDVGANIGEMVLDFARHPHIGSVYAFEPIKNCTYAIRVSILLNGYKNITLFECALSDRTGYAEFNYSPTNPSCSGIGSFARLTTKVKLSTLDYEFPEDLGNIIILLDVEGAERDVIKGGLKLIQREKPLIIFEYNNVSKSHFSLEKIKEILGPEYEIYRLRQEDGCLDRNYIKTWNCVAVHKNGLFYEPCRKLEIDS